MKYNELLKVSKEYDKDKAPELSDIMMRENLFPIEAKIGMVLTTYVDHMPYLKYTLSKYREVKDMFTIGAYDGRTIIPNNNSRKGFPFPDVWSLAHMWVAKHRTWSGHAKRHGWIWSHLYASMILRGLPNIKVIFSGNGDCAWDKPQGVYEIIDILGDNDFMSGQSETRHTDGFNFIHTCSMVFKREAYFSFIDYVMERMKKSGTASFSPESLIQIWTREHGVKWEHAPEQALYKTGSFKGHKDTYCEEGGSSTWKNILGFRNLEAEKNWRCSNKKEPLDKKYFDLRDDSYYKDNDRNNLVKYYLTGKEKYLKMYWYLDAYLPKEERIKRMQKIKKGEMP